MELDLSRVEILLGSTMKEKRQGSDYNDCPWTQVGKEGCEDMR